MSLAVMPDAKAPRRQSSKATKAQVAKPQKVSVYLTPESARRLGLHALMESKSQSAVVEGLIRESLRRYVVSDRGRADQVDPSADGESIDTAAA